VSKSVNIVILLGNVGKDPEIRQTPNGSLVANFSLATSYRYKDSGGTWKDKTTWHSCAAFAKTAEIVRDYVKKGSKVYVEGRLDQDTWQDKKSGENRQRDKVVVNSIVLCDGKQESRDDIAFDAP
jgi:single-strand DNA-binding protein